LIGVELSCSIVAAYFSDAVSLFFPCVGSRLQAGKAGQPGRIFFFARGVSLAGWLVWGSFEGPNRPGMTVMMRMGVRYRMIMGSCPVMHRMLQVGIVVRVLYFFFFFFVVETRFAW
jgi:hypothetical protein